VTASAHERAAALGPVLADARQQVAGLQGEIKGYEAEAHDAYVRGDAAGGDSLHEKAAALKPHLEAAAGRLQTLEQAVSKLSEQQQHESHEARLAAVDADLAATIARMQQLAAEVWPAVVAAKTALRDAQAAEERARALEDEQDHLHTALSGQGRPRFRPHTSDVRAMTEASRLLTFLLASDEA